MVISSDNPPRSATSTAMRSGAVKSTSSLVVRRPPRALSVACEDRPVLEAIRGHRHRPGQTRRRGCSLRPTRWRVEGAARGCPRIAKSTIHTGRPCWIDHEAGQGRIACQPPLEVQTASVGSPGRHGNEQAVNASSTQRREFLRGPEVLDPTRRRRFKQAIDVIHRTRLDDRLRIDLIHKMLCCWQPNRIPYPVDIRNQVGRFEGRVGES